MNIPPATVWPAPRAVAEDPWMHVPTLVAIGRGVLGRCPCCGKSPLFTSFLKVAKSCSTCPAPLDQVRAEDMPPYVVVVIVGHIMVASMLVLERYTNLSATVESAILLPLTALAALVLLQPVKGGVVGLMLKLGVLTPPLNG